MLNREPDPIALNKASLPPIPLRFDSRSERALCAIFEHYIPNWKPVMGETFQVPIGGNKRIDFLINDTLVEFHPIMINRELKSSEAQILFRQMYKRSNRWERGQLVDLLVSELGAQYSHRRWQLVSMSPHAGKQFLVCKNEREVYHQVILRFSPKPPSVETFKAEFYAALDA